jgi:hypothetical protein
MAPPKREPSLRRIVVRFANGDEYEGESIGGKQADGQGTMRYADGSTYKGTWKANEQDGFGAYYTVTGACYEGHWQSGKMEGTGKYKTPLYGNIYNGDFKAGNIEGHGTMEWRDGCVYVGEWLNAMQHGHGSTRYPNGDVAEGDWKENMPTENVVYWFASGERMTGRAAMAAVLKARLSAIRASPPPKPSPPPLVLDEQATKAAADAVIKGFAALEVANAAASAIKDISEVAETVGKDAAHAAMGVATTMVAALSEDMSKLAMTKAGQEAEAKTKAQDKKFKEAAKEAAKRAEAKAKAKEAKDAIRRKAEATEAEAKAKAKEKMQELMAAAEMREAAAKAAKAAEEKARRQYINEQRRNKAVAAEKQAARAAASEAWIASQKNARKRK